MDFALQQSSNLATTNWSDINVQPTLAVSNLSYQVSLPPTESLSFFRLENY
jgi:hypothetical protein